MKKIYAVATAIGLSLVALTLGWGMLTGTPVRAAPLARPLYSPGDCAVTTTADSGAGSLRSCMAQLAPGDTITFSASAFPLASPVTIALASALPDIVTDNVTIDGSSAGVILDGSGTPTYTNGLVIDGARNVVIKGLQILNFPNNGVELRNGASDNTLGGANGSPGGACSGDCNLISGNGESGISIGGSGTVSNTVSGNYLGTDVNGTSALGNGWDGVFIGDGASNNTVGGATAAERNIISGNDRVGVSINGQGSGTTGNLVHGNYIGTDVNGTTALGNGVADAYTGVEIYYSPGNTVESNLVSGNNGNGVVIQGDSSTGNVVRGNYIGTNNSGTAAISNTYNGVRVENDASGNVIGGDTAGERNLISGNGETGVSIGGSGTMSNTVSGNYIGANISGTAAISNTGNGVQIASGAQYNVIGGNNATPGGACTGECNLISSNQRGVAIWGSTTSSNTVSGNYIGTDVSGTAALGNWGGSSVLMWEGSYNLIGGDTPAERNLISANVHGVVVGGVSGAYNTIRGNYIGTDASGTADLGNDSYGIAFVYGGHDNVAENNLIAYSKYVSDERLGSGIFVSGTTSINNTLRQNRIHSNVDKGILLRDGGNLELFPPILTDVSTSTVEGLAPPNSTVEVFSDAEDEGRYYHGSTSADAGGHFTFTQATAFTGTHVTATDTDGDGNTSEFSAAYTPTVDVKVVAILQPKSSGKTNEVITPTIKIGNAGTTAESGINVAVQAAGSALSSDYGPHTQTVNLPPLGFATLTFPSLTPDAVGAYSFTATVTLTGDQNPGNDQQGKTVAVGSDVIDLWTRDNESDVGDIPAYPFWQSPDMWVRTADDGGAVHQDPIAGQVNWVYMIVRNRGTAPSDGADTAKTYWHEPSLGIKCGDWALIGTQGISSTAAPTGVQLLKFEWTPTRTGHTCLHGEITSDDDPVINPCDVPWDNNLSQRNVNIIPGGSGPAAQAAGGMVFEVTNVKEAPKPIDIIVDVSNVPDANAVRLDLGSDLSARWSSVNGIARSSGITWTQGSVITVTNPSSGTIGGIPFAAGETQTVTLLVNAPSVVTTTVSVYEAIDAGPGVPLIDAIVGGNTYVFSTEVHNIYLPVILKSYQ